MKWVSARAAPPEVWRPCH